MSKSVATPVNGRFAAGNPGGPSRKGKPNKATASLRSMILGALSDVGGQKYLADQARRNPKAFLSLLARVLPTEVKVPTGTSVVLLDWRALLNAPSPEVPAEAPEVIDVTPTNDAP